MASPSFHVVVVGAGIAGLCLAQGLKRAGISVAVYERDHAADDRFQGFDIHITPSGNHALKACLPSSLYKDFTAASRETSRGFSAVTEQLHELLFIDDADRNKDHSSLERAVLRQVLLDGMEDTVHFDKEFVRYAGAPGGRVTAHFEDGTAATGDVLVGADGVGSRVRQQLVPHNRLIDRGLIGIGARFPLGGEAQDLLPSRLYKVPLVVLAPGGNCMFIAMPEFIPAQDSAPGVGLKPDHGFRYVTWGFLTRGEKLGPNPNQMGGRTLLDAVSTVAVDWHPHLRRLISGADPAAVWGGPIRTSQRPAPWPTQYVTLVGDTIHSLPPTGGLGANVALRDAAVLSRNLTACHREEMPLLAAIDAYETDMRKYSFESAGAASCALQVVTSESEVVLALTRAALRMLDVIPPLKHQFFLRR